MAEELPPEERPIVVNPSATADMITTGLRQVALMVGGGVALIGLVRGHDLRAIAAWATSDDFGPFLSAALTIGVFVYGQARVLWNKRKTLTMANRVPDNIAVVLPRLPLRARIVALYHRLIK